MDNKVFDNVTLLKNKILERIFIPMRGACTEGLGETYNEGIHNACSTRNTVRRVKARIKVRQIRSEYEGDEKSVYFIQKYGKAQLGGSTA